MAILPHTITAQAAEVRVLCTGGRRQQDQRQQERQGGQLAHHCQSSDHVDRSMARRAAAPDHAVRKPHRCSLTP